MTEGPVADPDVRRLRVLRVAPEIMLQVMALGRAPAAVVKGLPLDVKLVRAGYDFLRDQFELMLRSAEWDVVPHGDEAPFVDVVYQSTLIFQPDADFAAIAKAALDAAGEQRFDAPGFDSAAFLEKLLRGLALRPFTMSDAARSKP